MKNYVTFKTMSPLHVRYAFIDTAEYLADQLFIKHKVKVKFEGEFTKPRYPYIVVECSVRKKDRERFLDALEELPNKMILMGHPDYEEACKEIIGIVEKETEA